MSDLRGRWIGISAITVLCALLYLGAFALPYPLQEQKQEEADSRQKPPIYAIEAGMVVVDVIVRDRKGNLLPGLTKEHFRVYEDNVPQEIVTFSAEQVAIGPPADEAQPGPEVEQKKRRPTINLGLGTPVKKEDLSGKRLIILFFDLSSLGTEGLIRSVDTSRDFITKQTGPQDLLAIASYSNTLSLLQDFTNDRELLLKTLASLASPESGEATAADLSDSETSEEVFVPDTVQFNIFNTDRRLSALETLAKMYREFPERKSLIYFSSGVTTTGIENNAQIRSTVDNANRSNMSIYTVDSRGLVALPPGGDASQPSAGRAMFSGSAMSRQRSVFSSSQETLTTLAYDTGGRAFTDLNDLGVALRQAQADTHIYYVLGYFSTNSKQDGKYRKIRVEVLQPGVKIEHRPGYFAAKSFERMNREERDLQLQQAMDVDRPFVDVPLIMRADYFRKDSNTTFVPLSIKLAGDSLKLVEKGSNYEGKFEFVAQVTSPRGKISSVARDAVQVRLPADRAEKLRSGGIFYSTGFELRPGDYKMKFLVRDNVTGKLGSFEQPISVPAFDLKKLTISSIVLGNQLTSTRPDAGASVTREGPMRRLQLMNPGYDPLVLGNQKIVPSIGNIFVARQTVYVYFHVYGATEDPETKKPCIEADLALIRNNTRILETQPQYFQEWIQIQARPFAGAGRGAPGMPPAAKPGAMGPLGGGDFGRMGGPPDMQATDERKGETAVAISLPLKDLKKGTYTLQVHVRDEIAGINQFYRVPLVIH